MNIFRSILFFLHCLGSLMLLVSFDAKISFLKVSPLGKSKCKNKLHMHGIFIF